MRPNRRATAITLCVSLISAVAALGQAPPQTEPPGRPRPAGPPPAAPPPEVQPPPPGALPPGAVEAPRPRPPRFEARPVRLDLSIHSVELSPENLLKIDAESLARHAGSASELDAALAALGTTALLYRVDQPLQLVAGPSSRTLNVSIASDVPYIVGTNRTQGERSVAINRSRAGVTVNVAPAPAADPSLPPQGVVAHVDISGVEDSNVQIESQVVSRLFRSVKFSEVFAPIGRPQVAISLDASRAGSDVSVAYVTRIVVTPLDGPGAPPPPDAPPTGRRARPPH
jgi:hypothetical protein